MAWQWKKTATADDAVNLSPTTGSELVYFLKEALKQTAWTVQSSSDGTTYNAAGDQITTGGSGAGGMANTNAWFRARSPAGAGGREIVIHRSTTDLLWRLKYSTSAGFTGGTPNATTPPTATDQQHVQGTDAPAFTSLWPTNATYKAHIGCDTTAPYSFFCLAVPNGGGSEAYLFGDGMQTGTFPSQDADPFLIIWSPNTQPLTLTYLSAVGTGPFGYYKKGLAGEAWVRFTAGQIYAEGAQVVPNNLGSNPYNGNDDGLAVPWLRRSALAQAGWKGFSSVLRWTGTTRSDGDYVDLTSPTERRVLFGDFSLPFPTAVIPSV